MFGQYSNIKICALSASSPSGVIDNKESVKTFGSKKVNKFVDITGVKQRHFSVNGQTEIDLSCVCAEKIFDYLSWNRNDIRAIVNVTQSAVFRTPSTAMIIQKKLGIGQDCIAFDVNLGCTGYVTGLQIVAAILQNTGGRGLLLTGDTGCALPDQNVSTDLMLFGDGASATAIELEEGNPMLYSQKTDGSRYQLMSMQWDGTLSMDGNSVFMFALNEVCDSIKDFFRHFQLSKHSIDFYSMHQAQKLIIDGIRHECNIEPDKMLTSYEDFGNTSTASIPITICRNRDKFYKLDRAKVYLCGYGVGLAWSSVVIDIKPENILPLEVTDFRFDTL